MYGGSGAYFLGYNHPVFKERFHAYINQNTVQRADIKSVELLSEIIPSAEMTRFCLSGTEAIQNAIRLSRAYTGRIKIVRFEGHYHGSADNIMGGAYDVTSFPEPYFDVGDPHYCDGSMPPFLVPQRLGGLYHHIFSVAAEHSVYFLCFRFGRKQADYRYQDQSADHGEHTRVKRIFEDQP